MDIAVLGLGVFGIKLARELYAQGNTVLAVDNNHDNITAIKDAVTQAVIADVTDEDVIRELDLGSFDIVVVCMSDHLENQILCTTLVKKTGAKRIIAKVNTEIHKEILLKLGADEVIQPEEQAALRLSKSISLPTISEIYKAKNGHIARVIVQPDMIDKTLKQLDWRNKFNISVVMIRRETEDEPELIWDPNTILEHGDELTILGKEDDIEHCFGGKQ